MSVGSHQGRDTDWVRERHYPLSYSSSRCHGRQTAVRVQWVSLLSSKRKDDEGGERTAVSVATGIENWRTTIYTILCINTFICIYSVMRRTFNDTWLVGLFRVGLAIFTRLFAASFSCHALHPCRICWPVRYEGRGSAAAARSIPLHLCGSTDQPCLWQNSTLPRV